MIEACKTENPAGNPGALLGIILGVCQTQGIDKLTIFTSPEIYDLGAWLEQLIAESTGKEGKGILPVVGEPLGDPSVYGDDRVFVSISLGNVAKDIDRKLEALAHAGHPIIRRELSDLYDLGAEFFVWEFATAPIALQRSTKYDE